MPTQLFASRIGLRQPEPPEGRFAFPLGTGAGGGGGFTFGTAGTDTYTFTSLSIQGQLKPSGILSMWIDASQIVVGTGTAKNLIVQTQNQRIVVALGSQGYIIVTAEMPFNITVTIDGTLQTGGQVANIVLYNYNVFYTGGAAAGRTSATGVPVPGTGTNTPGANPSFVGGGGGSGISRGGGGHSSL